MATWDKIDTTYIWLYFQIEKIGSKWIVFEKIGEEDRVPIRKCASLKDAKSFAVRRGCRVA